MKPFSKAYGRIGTESAFAVGPQIAAQEKAGFDVVRVNIGEPGGNIPEASTNAAIASFEKHETHYTPASGFDDLRAEIAHYCSITREIDYEASDVVLTPGGKPVIGATIMMLVDPGDEVIYPTPGYPIYESMIDYVGAKGKPVELREEKGFRFDIKDLEKLVSKKTKLLILNSPSNPTGGVLSEEDYKKIAVLAKTYDFYILSDECYNRIAFGDTVKKVKFKGTTFPVTHSIATQKGMAGRTVILDAFSKTYAMTGLRCGFAVSKNKEFIAKMTTFAINFWSCLPAPIMKAALASLGSDQSEAQKEIQAYEEKRDVAVKMLNEIEGVHCENPIGSFYLFPNVTKACKKLKLRDAEAMRIYLLSYDKKNKKGVAVLARKHFGRRLPSEKEEYIRLSIAGKLESIKEGIRRIKEAIEK
jgi:aspartate aminotransferase